MNISEAAAKSELTPVTLRYYERIGLIPPVKRKKGGVRDYQEEDLGWIDFIKCMRSAGLSIESLIDYVDLYKQGTDTAEARKEILLEEKEKLVLKNNEIAATIEKLSLKIQHYEE